MKKVGKKVLEQSVSKQEQAVSSGGEGLLSERDSFFIKNSWLRWLFPPAILTLLTSLIYYSSLNCPFQFDDIANISKRFGIRFDNPLARWWGSSRWFGDWLNIVNFKIGRFDPFSYRLINLIVHILAGLCVFFLVYNLCRFLTKKPFIFNNARLIAFVSGGLFLLHPVQTQTVSYVIQARLEGLATLFVLATLLTFVLAVQVKTFFSKSVLMILFGIFGLVSCGTKELVIVLPILLVLIDWFFISQEKWSAFKSRWWFHGLFLLAFVALMVHYLGSRLLADSLLLKFCTGNNRGNILTPHPFDVITPWSFFISQFRVILHYLWIFLWPFGISVEYDWKIASGFFSPEVIFPGLILAALLFFVISSAFRKKHAPLTFGLLWFFVAVAPRSTLIPSPELVCDYKTYLSSIGLMFILAVGLVYVFSFVWSFFENLPAHAQVFEVKIGVLAVLMLLVGLGAYQRNKVWSSGVDFWQDNVVKAPNKARVHNNFGVALSEAGRVDEAIIQYKKAISLDSYYADPWSNLAVGYSAKGEVDQAIDALKGAIHICPNYPEAYNNIGTLLLQKKMYKDSEQALNIAIRLRPYYGKAYYNMARLYEEKGEDEKSWEFLRKATEGDLDTPEVFFKFGQMSLKVKKYQEAADSFEKIVRLGHGSEQVWFNLANAYFMIGKKIRSRGIYERLVMQNPLDARFSYNLAEVYFHQKDYARAYDLFRKVTTLPKSLPQAYFRSVRCLEKMNRVEDAKEFLKELQSVTAPEEFKKMVNSELMRIDLQQKVNEGKGDISLKDLKKSLALRHGPEGQKQNQKEGEAKEVVVKG